MRNRGMKLNDEAIQQITRDFKNNSRDSWGTNVDDDLEDAEYEQDVKLYDVDGNPVDETVRRSTTPFVPERSVGQITSAAEKKAWIDRVKAMSDAERAMALKAFSDDELMNEMRNRLLKAALYIKRMKDVLREEDE